MKKKTLISIIACIIALVLTIITTCVVVKSQFDQPKDVTTVVRDTYIAPVGADKASEQVTLRISTTESTVPTTEETTKEIETTTEKVVTTTEPKVETTQAPPTEATTKETTEVETNGNVITIGGQEIELLYNGRYNVCSNPLTASMGVKHFNGHRETWYSQKVLPGGGLKIPGRHVADDGTVRDGEGYIVVASDLSYLSRGSVVLTSLGPGKVYDTGCAYGTIDIYVNW
jgi:hypothetical protein